MAARAIGRGAQPLTITRAQRSDLVERQVEAQSALDRASFLVANTTPEVDSLLDCHRLQRRIEAQLSHAISTAKGQARAAAGELEALEVPA